MSTFHPVPTLAIFDHFWPLFWPILAFFFKDEVQIDFSHFLSWAVARNMLLIVFDMYLQLFSERHLEIHRPGHTRGDQKIRLFFMDAIFSLLLLNVLRTLAA